MTCDVEEDATARGRCQEPSLCADAPSQQDVPFDEELTHLISMFSSAMSKPKLSHRREERRAWASSASQDLPPPTRYRRANRSVLTSQDPIQIISVSEPPRHNDKCIMNE